MITEYSIADCKKRARKKGRAFFKRYIFFFWA